MTILIAVASARAQQGQIDPAYLRQYYQQLAQQNGGVGVGSARASAPIYEPQEQQAPQQFVPQQQQPVRNYPKPVVSQQYVPEQQQARQYQSQQPQQVRNILCLNQNESETRLSFPCTFDDHLQAVKLICFRNFRRFNISSQKLNLDRRNQS